MVFSASEWEFVVVTQASEGLLFGPMVVSGPNRRFGDLHEEGHKAFVPVFCVLALFKEVLEKGGVIMKRFLFLPRS